MPVKDTIAKIKQDAADYCSAFLVRTDRTPLRAVSIGYLAQIQKWRMTVVREYLGMLIVESTVDSYDCNGLLDLAFEACENTRASLNIVIDETDVRLY